MGRRRCSRSKRKEKKGKKRTALSTTVFYSCVCKMIMFTCIRERKVAALFCEERFIKRCFQKEIFIDSCVLLNYHCVAMLLCPFNIGDEPP